MSEEEDMGMSIERNEKRKLVSGCVQWISKSVKKVWKCSTLNGVLSES